MESHGHNPTDRTHENSRGHTHGEEGLKVDTTHRKKDQREGGGEGGRERERDRQTDRHTDTQTQTQTQTERQTDRQTERKRERERERERERRKRCDGLLTTRLFKSVGT